MKKICLIAASVVFALPIFASPLNFLEGKTFTRYRHVPFGASEEWEGEITLAFYPNFFVSVSDPLSDVSPEICSYEYRGSLENLSVLIKCRDYSKALSLVPILTLLFERTGEAYRLVTR